MREIRTSGSMSGERKRSDGRMAPSHRASPRLYPYRRERRVRKACPREGGGEACAPPASHCALVSVYRAMVLDARLRRAPHHEGL